MTRTGIRLAPRHFQAKFLCSFCLLLVFSLFLLFPMLLRSYSGPTPILVRLYSDFIVCLTSVCYVLYFLYFCSLKSNLFLLFSPCSLIVCYICSFCYFGSLMSDVSEIFLCHSPFVFIFFICTAPLLEILTL